MIRPLDDTQAAVIGKHARIWLFCVVLGGAVTVILLLTVL